jgi:C4-type Zn-finger protein
MKKDFICPSCKSHLNIEDNVVFAIKKKDKQRGLIFLSPELGNYSIKKHDSLSFEEGEKVKIMCPICQKSLKCKEHDHQLVRVLMIDENDKQSSVLFSNIFGKECTYKVEDKIVKSFGQNLLEGVNFEELSKCK